MGGLLKNTTIKWVNRRSARKSQESRKRQFIPLLAHFFCILMLVLPPTESSYFRPPIPNMYKSAPSKVRWKPARKVYLFSSSQRSTLVPRFSATVAHSPGINVEGLALQAALCFERATSEAINKVTTKVTTPMMSATMNVFVSKPWLNIE
jgi:hypothetical protein